MVTRQACSLCFLSVFRRAQSGAPMIISLQQIAVAFLITQATAENQFLAPVVKIKGSTKKLVKIYSMNTFLISYS